MKNKEWSIEFESLARKEFKKIKKKMPKLYNMILERIKNLKKYPLEGEALSGDLAGYRKLKVKFQNDNYRIVYQVIDNEVIILIIKINNRKDFYRDLKNYLKTK